MDAVRLYINLAYEHIPHTEGPDGANHLGEWGPKNLLEQRV